MLSVAFRSVVTVMVFLNLLATWVVAWVVQWIAMIFMWPFSTPEQRSDVCGFIFRALNFIPMDLLNPLWRIRVVKPLPAFPKDRPVIVMINHLSNADPWALLRFFLPSVDCKWICKGSLFKVPFGGWCLANNGDLAVRFTKARDGWGTEKGSVKMLMQDATELLRRNQPIAVFPEGVRSKDPEGGLQEFKPGFFDLAVKEGALILPVAMSGNENMWPVRDWRFGFATSYISSGEFIDTKDHTTESIIAKTREVITELRETHPDRIEKKKQQ